MKVLWQRLLCAAILLGIMLPPGLRGQGNEPVTSLIPEAHYWVVLLDVSLSFKQRDSAQSRALEVANYKLRNELLSLFQTVLVTLQTEQGNRGDHLVVYVFGKGVQRIEDLSEEVRWGNIQDEDWWENNIPTGLGGRTELFEALRRAKEHFEASRVEGKKHLLLISDGELDTGEGNRQPGGAMEREELELYRNYLRPTAHVMQWLADNSVSVLTLAIDEELAGPNDSERQREIQERLYRFRFVGDTPLDWARGLVEDLAGKADAAGRLPYSEGPYVLQALAQAFGGRSRSVRYDNVLQVLKEDLLGREFSRLLPPETREFIVLAPRDASVPFRVQEREQGTVHDLNLTYDPVQTICSITPQGPVADRLQRSCKATSQYVTWRVKAPPSLRLIEFDTELLSQAVREQLTVVPITNIRLEWREAKPPRELLAGRAAYLVLELIRRSEDPELGEESEEGWTVEQWRHHLRPMVETTPSERESLVAWAKIYPPDGSPARTVPLEARVPDGPTYAVLELAGVFEETMFTGPYRIEAELRIGAPPDDWPMRARAISFSIQREPIPVALHVRPVGAGGHGAAILLDPLPPGEEDAIELRFEESPRVVFEWWTDSEEGCGELEELGIELSDPQRSFGPTDNELPEGEPPREEDQSICYRTAPVVLAIEPGGAPVVVRGHNGVLEWERLLLIREPPPWWLKGCLLPLLAALALGAVLFAIPGVRKPLRERLRKAKAIRQAKFPLAVSSGGRWSEWSEGAPKRILTSVGRDGEVHAEFTRRELSGAEQGVELLPVSKQRYRLRALAGTEWSYRVVKKDAGAGPGFSPLGRTGEVLNYADFVDEVKLELRHRDNIVTICHRAYR